MSQLAIVRNHSSHSFKAIREFQDTLIQNKTRGILGGRVYHCAANQQYLNKLRILMIHIEDQQTFWIDPT